MRQDPLAQVPRHKYNASMGTRIRRPIVAGAFYPGEPSELKRMARRLLGDTGRGDARRLSSPVALIAPHAGYVYSGEMAAAGLREVAKLGAPETVILLGASHTGYGSAIALDDHDQWETPLGSLPVDRVSVSRLADAGLSVETMPFVQEHSIEVQLPLIQTLWPEGVAIVPICVQSTSHGTLAHAADAIADLAASRPILLLASSDFTHYEPQEEAVRLDRKALDLILARDVDAFLALVQDEGLTICGAAAIAILMTIAYRLRLADARLIHYATSGDVTGDRESVVGYASVLFSGGEHDS